MKARIQFFTARVKTKCNYAKNYTQFKVVLLRFLQCSLAQDVASGWGIFVASYSSALAFRYSLVAGKSDTYMYVSHPLKILYLPVILWWWFL